VKRKIRAFCESSRNAGKAKFKKFCLLTLILLTVKGAVFLNLTSCFGKFNQENVHQTLSESASFCKRYDKNILIFVGSPF